MLYFYQRCKNAHAMVALDRVNAVFIIHIWTATKLFIKEKDMAYICHKPQGTKCAECEHYRYDEENDRMACFAQQDLKNK